MSLPWKHVHLAGWSIVGMNHYHVHGERYLFVAITRGGRCIKAEGPDDYLLWEDLARRATESEIQMNRLADERPTRSSASTRSGVR